MPPVPGPGGPACRAPPPFSAPRSPERGQEGSGHPGRGRSGWRGEFPRETATVADAPPPEVAELLKKGNCVSCHGANFTTPIDPSYPKLAGQHPDYLYVALKAYQTDKNPEVGRANPIMMGMARPYTHSEVKLLAAYIASLPTELKTVAQSRWR